MGKCHNGIVKCHNGFRPCIKCNDPGPYCSECDKKLCDDSIIAIGGKRYCKKCSKIAEEEMEKKMKKQFQEEWYGI